MPVLPSGGDGICGLEIQGIASEVVTDVNATLLNTSILRTTGAFGVDIRASESVVAEESKVRIVHGIAN